MWTGLDRTEQAYLGLVGGEGHTNLCSHSRYLSARLSVWKHFYFLTVVMSSLTLT